jgi:hypothetical protein
MRNLQTDATYTSSPATPAPSLLCPVRQLPLVYRLTVVPAAKRSLLEYLECRTCGLFEYRDDTHALVSLQVTPPRSVI